MGVFVWRRAIAPANLDRTDQHSVLVRVKWDPNPFSFVATLTVHHHLTLYLDHRSGPLEMWTDLDQTGGQLHITSVRFCGGQHLDHITAYSANNVPVLELCRRSDLQRVMAHTIRTHQPMTRLLSDEPKYAPTASINSPVNSNATRTNIHECGVQFVGIKRDSVR